MIYLSLGSNQGDRMAHLRGALADLAARRVRSVACSPVYRTEPVGGPEQPEFLNLVVEVETDLAASELLDAVRAVERRHGRRRTDQRWGPRTLDVDLLLYGDQRIRIPGLEVPHPRCHLRRFVLVPLADVAPHRAHPVHGLSVAELLARCPDRGAVTRYGPPLPLPGEAAAPA